MLLFFTNSFIVDEFIRLWEVPVTDYSELGKKEYSAGIVLGGGMASKDAETGKITFQNNVDRILQAVYLHDKGIIKKIIISSGSGSLIYRNILESVILKDYLVNTLKISGNDIFVDSVSDNTYQNAVFSSEIIKQNFNKGSFMLITSSLHVKRAKACFEKQNISVDVFATNKITGKRRFDLLYLLTPDAFAITKWHKLLHEITGFCVYYIIGYL